MKQGIDFNIIVWLIVAIIMVGVIIVVFVFPIGGLGESIFSSPLFSQQTP